MHNLRPIGEAPLDGRPINLYLVDKGEIQFIAFNMWWNPRGFNAMVMKPGQTGLWQASSGDFTWSEHDGAGPTHFCEIQKE